MMWAENRFPTWFTLACLTLILVAVLVRLALMRCTPMDRQINMTLVFAAVAAVLREPAVARVLAPVVPGGAPAIFDVWHFAFVAASASGAGVFILHERRAQRYHGPARRLMAIAGVIGLGFVILSHPAREAGLSVSEYGGWRYGLYFLLCCPMPMAACFYVLRPLFAPGRAISWREKLFVTVTFLYMVLGTANLVALAAGACMDAAGIEGALARETQGRAAGELMAPFVAVIAVVLLVCSLEVVAQLFRLDRTSRATRALKPLWRTLTRAVPEVVLPLEYADRWGASSQERLHRRRVEIYDAAVIAGRFAKPLPTDLEARINTTVPEEDRDHLRSVTQILAAAQRLTTAGRRPRADSGQPGVEVDLETLMRWWRPASTLLAAEKDRPGTGTKSPIMRTSPAAGN